MAAAVSLRVLAFAVVVLVAGLPTVASAARLGKQYKVGGPDGWRVPPPEDKDMYYTNWTAPITFYVDDSLEFVYKNDSVIKVDKVGYYHCNETVGLAGPGAGAAAAPLDGSMVFLLDAPGDAYFTSADPDHCKMGERLMINVLAADQPPAPSPSWASAPQLQQAPAGAPSSRVISPATAPSVDDATGAAGSSLVASLYARAVMLVPVALALACLI